MLFNFFLLAELAISHKGEPWASQNEPPSIADTLSVNLSFHVHAGLPLTLPPSVSLHPSHTDLYMHHAAVTTAVEVAKIPTISKHFLPSAIYCDKNTYHSSTTLGKGSS